MLKFVQVSNGVHTNACSFFLEKGKRVLKQNLEHLACTYDCKEWSQNCYYLLVKKYISHISNGSLKSLRKFAYLRRCFPATNHRSVSSNSNKIESCSFCRTSLWDIDVVEGIDFFLFLDYMNSVLGKCYMYL